MNEDAEKWIEQRGAALFDTLNVPKELCAGFYLKRVFIEAMKSSMQFAYTDAVKVSREFLAPRNVSGSPEYIAELIAKAIKERAK